MRRRHRWPLLARRHRPHCEGHHAGLIVDELSDQLRWRDDGNAPLSKQLAVEVANVIGDTANADFSRALVSVANATEYALEGTPGAIYVLAWDVLRGSDGSSSSESANDSDGNPVVVRISDGYHLTDDGARLVSDRVLFALRANGFNL